MALNQAKVERALRSILSDIDYDLHKSLESDEETGENTYPDVTNQFITFYNNDEEDI